MKTDVSPIEFLPTDYFAPVAPNDLYPRDAPLELDLGCGDGGFLLEMAARFPERNFLGVERLLGRVRKICRKAERRGLANVRVLRLDSDYVVKWLMEKATLSRVHLLFPDPWPKKKHHKRRMMQPEFVKSVRELLEPGGEFLFKTDHEEYFEEASVAVTEAGVLEVIDWNADDFFYAETDFERQWKAEGKFIQGLRLKKEG